MSPIVTFIVAADKFSPQQVRELYCSLLLQPLADWQCLWLVSVRCPAETVLAIERCSVSEARSRMLEQSSQSLLAMIRQERVFAAPGCYISWINAPGWFARETMLHLAHLARQTSSPDLIVADEDAIDRLGRRSPKCCHAQIPASLLWGRWRDEHLICVRTIRAQALLDESGEAATMSVAYDPTILYHRHWSHEGSPLTLPHR